GGGGARGGAAARGARGGGGGGVVPGGGRPRRWPVCALDLPPGAPWDGDAGDGSVGCGTTPAAAAELDPGTTGGAGALHRRHADHNPRRPQKDRRGLSGRAHALAPGGTCGSGLSVCSAESVLSPLVTKAFRERRYHAAPRR